MESRSSPSCVSSCTSVTILLSISWILVSLVMLIYFGVVYVAPYNRIKDWNNTDCYIIHSDYISMEPCKCGIKCKGRFPCLRIIADCTKGGTPLKMTRTQLYYTETDMDSSKCSYYPRDCSSHEKTNNLTVFFIKQEYAPAQRHLTQNCRYNPKNDSEISIHLSAKYQDVAYTITMGIMSLLLGFMLFFIMLFCRNKEGLGRSCC